MNKTIIILLLIICKSVGVSSAQQLNWQLQPGSLKTRWAKEVSPANTLKGYPRPQMQRKNWINLNGLWDYSITSKIAVKPAKEDGQILVPYPLESSLSGVKKSLSPEQYLWYSRKLNRPVMAPSEKLILHFGAVDYEASVFINGKEIGSHTGGYTGFSFDITDQLTAAENDLVVRVFDPSDQGIGPHGKQVLNPANIYYTPSSGIWQTVWMEVVPANYISGLVITPDIDRSIVNITVNSSSNSKVSLTFDGHTITGQSNTAIAVPVAKPKLWSPGNPFLYQFTAQLGTDQVVSYFGMRKISVEKDNQGIDRIFLNGKPYFNLGTLDQGFWPDGLYTAPTDEALAFDIKAIKAMGFNTIRKHIKVEPARWYYWADKLGMLVWQDMVNPNQRLPEGSKPAFEKQSAEVLSQLHNYPSITTWVLFNEKWGQYDQERLTKWIKDTDPSRLVNGHSGEYLYVNEKLRSPSPNAYVNADMTDVHSYPDPMISLKQAGKAQVLGEFGGIGVFIADHQWNINSAWGYIQEKPAALKAKYTVMNQHLELLQKEGLSGSIYTQPFDVEGEQNGLMTYDRAVIKIPFAELRKIHSTLNPDMGAIPKGEIARDADLTDPVQRYSSLFKQYLEGRRDSELLKKLAISASQTNDLAGKSRFGAAYISLFKKPYTNADLEFIENNAKKVTDPGFDILLQRAVTLPVADGRKLQVALMNIIYTDVISGFVPNAQAKPDWQLLAEKIKPYGIIGEEIFLRAKVIHTFNQQDWKIYVPTAVTYLEKYGQNVLENEKKTFQLAIDQHKQ